MNRFIDKNGMICRKCEVFYERPDQDFFRDYRSTERKYRSPCKACLKNSSDVRYRRVAEHRRYHENKSKDKARNAARFHYGKSEQWKCSVLNCSIPSSNLHHVSYEKPLDVVPLCREHHLDNHRVVRGIEND